MSGHLGNAVPIRYPQERCRAHRQETAEIFLVWLCGKLGDCYRQLFCGVKWLFTQTVCIVAKVPRPFTVPRLPLCIL